MQSNIHPHTLGMARMAMFFAMYGTVMMMTVALGYGTDPDPNCTRGILEVTYTFPLVVFSHLVFHAVICTIVHASFYCA